MDGAGHCVVSRLSLDKEIGEAPGKKASHPYEFINEK